MSGVMFYPGLYNTGGRAVRLLCLSSAQNMSGLFVETIASLPVLTLLMSGLGLLGAGNPATSTLVKVSHGLIP